jgi:recombination protein RecT
MSTQVANVKDFSNFMDKLKGQLALALPQHMNADRMARLAVTAFSTSANMQRCTPISIAAAIMTAGQLGLEPGVNGAGYLIPYKDTCTFVPGWKGLVDLVSRSGRGTVFTGVIFKDQRYTFTDGARRDLVIHNETNLDAPEDITHAYAIGWVRDAAMPVIELWGVEKIRKHRDKYNKQGNKHYSFKDWEMYARKIPLLQVLKYMPSSVELSNAIAVTHASEAGRGVTIEDGIVIDFGDQETEAPAAKTLPECTQESFAKQSAGWKAAITSGKKTVNELISFIEGRETLNDDQKTEIASWKATGENA